MSGYPYHPIKIERDEETGALRYKVTINLFEEYMRMIDRKIAEEGEAAMDAALEAHGYTKARIVRCKDCKHYRDRINGCAEFGDESRGEFANVEPEGYCALGERLQPPEEWILGFKEEA